MRSPRDGDQLVLEGLGLTELARVPWGGVSPRVLTRGHGVFILKAQAAKSMSEFVSGDQGDFWLPFKTAPWVYQGAPLLKELA